MTPEQGTESPTAVYASDTAFSMPLAVALRSLANVNPSARVFILHDRIATKQQLRVTMSLPQSLQLHWIDASGNSLDHIPVPAYLNRCSLFRLRMDELLPADVDRVVYLDADTLLCRPLDELWRFELGEQPLAAVRDPAVPWIGAPRGLPWRTLGLEPQIPYFNAGVMLVSLARWRARDIGRHALNLLATHEFRWADQCALNAALHGDWKIIEPMWNVQAAHLAEQGSLGWIVENRLEMARALDTPAIVHFNFSTMNRPWQPLCRHPERQRWFEVLDSTAWAGWRPREPRHTAAAAIGRRLKRAFRVLLRGG